MKVGLAQGSSWWRLHDCCHAGCVLSPWVAAAWPGAKALSFRQYPSTVATKVFSTRTRSPRCPLCPFGLALSELGHGAENYEFIVRSSPGHPASFCRPLRDAPFRVYEVMELAVDEPIDAGLFVPNPPGGRPARRWTGDHSAQWPRRSTRRGGAPRRRSSCRRRGRCARRSPAGARAAGRGSSDDRGEVGERAAGRARAALEQRVAAESTCSSGAEEAHAARAVTRRVQHAQARARDVELVAVGQRAVGRAVGVHDVPEHPVGGVEQHGRVDQRRPARRPR